MFFVFVLRALLLARGGGKRVWCASALERLQPWSQRPHDAAARAAQHWPVRHGRNAPLCCLAAAPALQAGVGSVLGGWLADRLGRRPALLLADVLFAAGSAAMAAAQEQWALIAGGGSGPTKIAITTY